MKQNEYLDKFMAQFPFEGLTYDDVSLVLQYADFLPDTTDLSKGEKIWTAYSAR